MYQETCIHGIVAVVWTLTLAAIGSILFASAAAAAPAADLWPRWQVNDRDSVLAVDHTPWDTLLAAYLVTGHPSGINRFRYGDVSPADREMLDSYLRGLQDIPVSSLNRNEQKAYWINLYNSLTVRVILDHYPIRSIRDIDISPGFFSSGPWDAKLLTIEGEKLSLNDMEHRILRPIFRDNRLHYALNCASLGCPNLQTVAFTAANTETLLEAGAEEYVNSPRGAEMIQGRLQVSSIYKWFREDFGGSEQGVLDHLRKYAVGDMAEQLKTYSRSLRYDYDWSLNEP